MIWTAVAFLALVLVFGALSWALVSIQPEGEVE